MSLTIQERWKFIPSQWRFWWVNSVDGVDIETPPPEVFDVTNDKLRLENSIKNLNWVDLSQSMDDYLQVPTVRCPWGCGIFLHQTQQIPFGELLLARSNFAYLCQSKSRGNGRKWTDSCRPDFPSSALISDNHSLKCFPCIVTSKEGAFILSCENHNHSTTSRFIHIPVNPTGSLFTDASNQYAPVVLRSRSLRKVKINRYSDSYETVRLQGGYGGIDSCYLSAHGRYNHANSLSQLRDSLSIQGRDDVKHHIRTLCENMDSMTYVPKSIIDAKVDLAVRHYPDVEEVAKKELSSSTYVTLQDAIALQEHCYNQASISIYVPNDASDEVVDENVPGGMQLFDPPWPFKVIRVHRFDAYGERFSGIQDIHSGFNAWSHLVVMLCVDEMWTLLTNSLSTALDPAGFLLSLASKHVYGKSCNNSGKSFYKIYQVRQGSNETLQTIESKLRFVDSVFPWPASYIDVQQHVFTPYTCTNDIAVVYYHGYHLNESQTMVGEQSEQWEPVLYIIKSETVTTNATVKWSGEIYARHGGEKHTSWWYQGGIQPSTAHFVQFKSTSTPNLDGLYLAVYKRKNPTSWTSVKERLLRCLGGQTSIYCEDHHTPLIVAGSKEMKCSCAKCEESKEWEYANEDSICNKEAEYTCPISACAVSCCGSHFTSLCSEIGSDFCILGTTSCKLYSNYQRSVVFSVATNNFNAPEGFEHSSVINEEDEEELEPSALEELCNAPLQESHQEQFEYNYDPLDISELGPTEAQDYGLDLVVDDEEEDNTFMMNPFLSTEAQQEETLQAMLIAEEEISSAPLHIQLNRQGHCLIRQNAKLRMCNRHKAFFQRYVARCKGKTVPLLYSESTIFPDIFYFSTKSGEVLGAIPTALWTDSSSLSKYGIASMKEHAQVRVRDPALLTSTDSRYHFMKLDILVNLGLRGEDSRVVLHRGFAEKQGKHEGVSWRQQEGNEELYEDNVETHSNVYKLSRLVAESPPDYFYTQSCNQETTKGLRILRKWVTSDDAIQQTCDKYNLSEKDAQQIIRTSAAPFVQRSWNAFIDLWMRYIINSDEAPLCAIDWAWYRKEFQPDAGNVSHTHCLLKTIHDSKTKEGRDKILDKVRGALADLVRYQELCRFKEEGVIDSLDCLKEILEDAVKYLSHKCGSRCLVPRKDANGNVTWVCKRQDNYLLSSSPGTHCIQEVYVNHSGAALDLMMQCGFAERDESTGVIHITDPNFKMYRHVPRCHKLDGKFSPTNAELFVKYRSSQNVQIALGHSLNVYLTSYIVEIDKASQIWLRPPVKHDPNVIRAEHESLHNTKIASVKAYNKKKMKEKKKPPPVGRPVTQMEALTVIQGDSLVTSTRQFLRVPTCAREYRAGVSCNYKKKSPRAEDLQFIRAVVGQSVRKQKHFPPSRMFSDMQIQVIEDELQAPLKSDQVTVFSMRPPELVFVDNVIEYTRWFTRLPGSPLFNLTKTRTYLNSVLDIDVEKSHFVDGFNCQVVVKTPAILPLFEFATSRYNNTDSTRKPLLQVLNLLEKIKDYVTNSHRPTRERQPWWDQLEDRFLDPKSQKHLPVVWWTPIYPKRRTPFLVQMLLTEGRFETEYELMLTGDLRRSFELAGLLCSDKLRESLMDLVSTYLDKHLRPLPGNFMQFDRNSVESHAVLQELYFPEGDTRTIYGTPSVLYTSMISETDTKVTEYCQCRRECLVDAIYLEIEKCNMLDYVPDKNRIINSREQPLSTQDLQSFFPPRKHPSQNIASYEEQKCLMEKFKLSVDLYRNAYTKHRNIVTVGGPGVGKTTVAVFCSLYCLGIGLNGITTSLVSDRSKELGGIHFHQLVSLTGRNDNLPPGQSAEKAIAGLYRNPESLEFLKRLDFINLDELGVFSAQNMAIFDMVLRYVRQNSQFMGGLFVFCTIDHLQLLPFKGTPVLLSMYVITDFTFIRLVESVRAAEDPALRRIIAITRLSNLTNRDKKELRDLIANNCNFVRDFQDEKIPQDAVFVFGRKEPCQAAEDLLLQRMKTVHANTCKIVVSYDEESTTGGNWKLAGEATSKGLTRNMKHRKEVLLYPKARFEFTHVLKNKFNQGQLALLLEVPSDQHLQEKKPIEVFKAPSGVKQFPSDQDCNQEWLVKNKWIPVKVPFDTTPVHQIGRRLQARRTQYGIKPRVSSTIHACMGSTLASIVTCLVSTEGMRYKFSLWEQALIVVLLSRTRKAKDMYFVGDKNKTIDHIIEVLTGSQNRYIRYISALLDKLCGETEEIPVISQPTMFRPKDAVINPVPAVYLLISTQDFHMFYIGETTNLVKRIQDHNTGNGPAVNEHFGLLPFALFAYMTGFQNQNERKSMESIWKHTATRRKRIAQKDNGLVEIGRDLVEDYNKSNPNFPEIRIISCGTVTTR